MIDPKLLNMLRCPIGGETLSLADETLIRSVHDAIDRGEARDRLDQKVNENIDGGLVTTSGQWLYPIRGGIPTLVAEEAICIENLSPTASG